MLVLILQELGWPWLLAFAGVMLLIPISVGLFKERFSDKQ